jgi:hypothetical protein
MDEDKVLDENSNTSEEVVPETTSDTEEKSEESVEEVKARLAKAEELAQNYKVRAEKAEKKAKEVVREESKTTKPSSDLSSKDLMALMNAKVETDDVDEIVDYAKFKGISVAEALKTGVIKTSLAEKAEQRKIADATNTGTSKRSSGKVSDDVLLSNASKGILPESDEDMERLFNLRKGIKK